MKKKDIKRKKKREMLKDFLKKNLKNWKEQTKQNPLTNRTTA
ncbi:hypothetical protein [Halalkalibacter nanhaiisediminis]|uniref:Uncharacterized protein n=1 Tax=Halalkalibacter nanhaiisediminis TaxID=688079 RepID=A0A562QAV1_9BACI|nr:hypothetical protein [Halalkalibacter nanhaiisediminis]TWI53300.1 hypothetical protein IQ10_03434 [Halalkalibacter nanhaiisediminis]